MSPPYQDRGWVEIKAIIRRLKDMGVVIFITI